MARQTEGNPGEWVVGRDDRGEDGERGKHHYSEKTSCPALLLSKRLRVLGRRHRSSTPLLRVAFATGFKGKHAGRRSVKDNEQRSPPDARQIPSASATGCKSCGEVIA